MSETVLIATKSRDAVDINKVSLADTFELVTDEKHVNQEQTTDTVTSESYEQNCLDSNCIT